MIPTRPRGAAECSTKEQEQGAKVHIAIYLINVSRRNLHESPEAQEPNGYLLLNYVEGPRPCLQGYGGTSRRRRCSSSDISVYLVPGRSWLIVT